MDANCLTLAGPVAMPSQRLIPTLDDVTARSYIIRYGIMDISQSAVTGIGWFDFTRRITYYRLQRVIKVAEELVILLQRPLLMSDAQAIETRNSIRKLVVAFDVVINAQVHYYKKDQVNKKLSEIRDELEDIWDDFCILTDKEEVKQIQNSRERMKRGKNISHEEFWSRLGIQD